MGSDGTIVFAGGGTGGHLYPGISVAVALKSIWPEVRPLFLVTEREIDEVILKPTGFEFTRQPIVPPVTSISGLLAFWKSWRQTKDLVKGVLKDRNVVAVLGLGGYAAGVAVKLAAEKGIPAAVVNPDVIPGKANQYLMKYSLAVCCQFDQTRAHVSAAYQGRLKLTGCPIRPEMASLPARVDAARRLGLNPDLLTLVITGASLGAQTVNEAVLETLPKMKAEGKMEGWQVLHLAGRDHAQTVKAAYIQNGIGATVVDFTPEMADVWAVADLTICRSGASSCAELTACGLPSILMPYPYHKDMHQRANARVLEAGGAALILDDEKEAQKNSAKLGPMLQPLLCDAVRRQQMADAAKKLGKPDAAEQVARVIRGMATTKSP
ncbi:MAG: UDP-N-acetylglucosamine--N-acetylmuramyl-(pentapeptide) pyrophosphoryl-undecaprenol N-acetylglucosamine transferase [Tepidisphaeraceae bacterium]|jgi:UDP-N-acetylglucosamine--N-acetylmuramyl-(pentapeptide) pyrophosphoryl-undecaprenol N-acetylglucosamine transferase